MLAVAGMVGCDRHSAESTEYFQTMQLPDDEKAAAKEKLKAEREAKQAGNQTPEEGKTFFNKDGEESGTE